MSKRENSFSITARVKVFSHAFAGLKDMLLTEPNAWIHAFATVLVLELAWWLGIDSTSFALIIIAIVLVWVAEAFNTVLEIMANLVVGQRYSKIVKRAKDIAAAAVLIAAIGALGVGIVILGPHIYLRMAPLFG
ncbi:MAG: diacylglycerol kinase family protein [Candidatus Omnitrophica bacterium]|nr:diacylglycerol kinase family protein [Candidatus Omnitrophota bacterium]